MASERELRVEKMKRTFTELTDDRGFQSSWVPGVWLEYDGEGRAGDLEPWMLGWLWSRNPHLLPDGLVDRIMGEAISDDLLDVAGVHVAINRHIRSAIERILKEASDGE